MEHSIKFKIFSKNLSYFNTINALDENTNFNDKILTVFYHSHYDYLDNPAITFSNSLFNKNWDYLKNNNAVLIFSNHKEIININYLVNEIDKIVNTHLIPSNKIYIILYDELHQDSLEKKLQEYKIEGINIDVYNYWLPCIWEYKKNTMPKKNIPKKRFSILCRSHKKDRMDFYVDLINNNILEDCLYTYKGTNSDIWDSYYTPAEVLNELSEPSEKVKQWLKDFPYDLDADRFLDSSYLVVRDVVENSDFNIILETHCDCSGNEFALVTEKTYKAIFFKKPFLVYGEPFHLESLKKLGFLTFDGIIDESYDKELDKIKRKKMVIEQLIKIKNLNEKDFSLLVKKCEKIIEHNYIILKNKVFLQKWSKKFKDLKIFSEKFSRAEVIFYENYKIFTKVKDREYQITLYKNIDFPKFKISKISIKELFTPMIKLKIFWATVLVIWLVYFLQLRIT